MRYGSLFAGYGGLEMGVSSVLGGEPAWFSEIDNAPSKILAHHWPAVPNLGDITKVDWASVPPVDVITAGFPCTDVSHAGLRLGLKPGTRSGLWSYVPYAIAQLKPRLVVIENVRGLLSAEAGGDLEPCPWCVGDGEGSPLRALGAVLGDLADLGYDAQWHGVRASDAGAPHGRFRVFVYAWPAADPDHGTDDGQRSRQTSRGRGPVTPADADRVRHQRTRSARGRWRGPTDSGGVTHANATSDTRRISHGDGLSARRTDTNWGDYEPAIRRWEHLTRPAPPPTEPGKNGAARLSPRFVEFMMGLPAGHVTGVPGLSRNDQLKALGNGVVPQQAALATRAFLATHLQESAA